MSIYHQSKYDTSRETVGKIYRELQMNADKYPVETGDMVNALMKGLVEDINEAIALGYQEFAGKPFYILIHEKKDLQMKSALLRRIFRQTWRPWPEDDTTVFWHHPSSADTRFCWSLPHWSDMKNITNNYQFYDPALVNEIIAWQAFDLYAFGFKKDKIGNWIANPKWKDKPLSTLKAAA